MNKAAKKGCRKARYDRYDSLWPMNYTSSTHEVVSNPPQKRGTDGDQSKKLNQSPLDGGMHTYQCTAGSYLLDWNNRISDAFLFCTTYAYEIGMIA